MRAQVVVQGEGVQMVRLLAEVVRRLLLARLVLLDQGVLQGQMVPAVDEQLILEVRGRVQVLAGLPRAASLDIAQ